MKTTLDLYQLLIDVQSQSNSNFSGLGLILYKNLHELPFSSLKTLDKHIHLPIHNYEKVVSVLASVSTIESRYHDGFHLLNQKLELTHLSQYISPPIAENISLLNEYGSRYRTAQYASLIPSIIGTGVLSVNYPITIFNKGKEVYFN